jgi:hypothetical protein
MPWSAVCITNTSDSEFSAHTGLGRGPPAPNAAILCALLQRNQNAPIVERRCATHTPGSAEWTHRVACHGRRATSPICSNLSFRHTQVRGYVVWTATAPHERAKAFVMRFFQTNR